MRTAGVLERSMLARVKRKNVVRKQGKATGAAARCGPRTVARPNTSLIHADNHRWHLLFLLEVRVPTEATPLALTANLKFSRGAPCAQTTADRLVSVHLPLHYGDRLLALCDMASV